MERTVILEFSRHQSRTDFIKAMKLDDYTLHKKTSVLFCRLNKEGIKTAIKDFGAKDISYQEPPRSLFGWFLEIVPWL